MKTRSFLLLIACLMLIGSELKAQGFGVRAGVNFQNINGKDNLGEQLKNNLVTGFHAGVNYEVPVGTDIYFQPGLLFSTKGTKYEADDSKLSLSYIELPLNIIFKPLLGSGHMLLGFGPYIGYGVGGKIDGVEDLDVIFQGDVNDGDADGFYVKPFDAGANFIIGYEMASMLSFQLNAQLGLLDIHPNYDADIKAAWKNTGFGLSVGYRF